MKKGLVLIALSFVFFSCSKENPVNIPVSENYVSIQNPETVAIYQSPQIFASYYYINSDSSNLIILDTTEIPPNPIFISRGYSHYIKLQTYPATRDFIFEKQYHVYLDISYWDKQIIKVKVNHVDKLQYAGIL